MSGLLPEPVSTNQINTRVYKSVLITKKQPVNIIGCGYLGKKLVQQLLSRQLAETTDICTLVQTHNSQKQCAEYGVHSATMDLDDICSVIPDTFKINQSLLYYFAPPPGQGIKDTRIRHFLELLTHITSRDSSTRPARVVLISTTGVYGNCHGQWIDETTPLNPGADRARRRVDAEQQIQSYCQSLAIPLVILRVSGIYGPGKLPLKRIMAKTPIVRKEDSPYSNRIHVDDLLEICLQAGLSEQIEGVFNCADGHPSTMYDYFVQVARTKNLPEPPSISLEQARTQLSSGMLSYMEESRRIDNHKLLSVFNITLKCPDLEQGLKYT